MTKCEAGHCRQAATVDFGRYIQATGVAGKVRFLCDWHARGLKKPVAR